MWTYQPPLRDIRFVVEDVIGAPARWRGWPALAEVDADVARQVVEEAGRFAAEILAPTNQPGDTEGCRYEDGQVRTPAGFRDAYQAFVQAGWPALACDPAVGGQGLPHLLNAALYEMLTAANHAWTMYPGLLQGAYDCLHAHASEDIKRRYLGKVVSGEWLSTMCLTEAHAGSDLGLLRTRAEPQADGSYLVTGTKIFISGGQHDLTDNIVHLVLARLPDAPSGTRGISLFIVPKRLPLGEDDAAGFAPNAVRCDGIEKKMGIKGSATCVLSFEGARGFMVGEPNRGLAAMFAMMNASRLHVGLQGLGHAEAACQNAWRYASERLQMRAARRPEGAAAGGAADPILWHPAVRRTLWGIKARLEGARIVAYDAAALLDEAAHEPDAQKRDQALEIVSLLTPVIKASFTDNGFQSASQALQLYGGHGYVHDYGIEQCVRDSRIAMIYEGTNEIQAIDLLVRKMLPDGGARLGHLLAWIDERLAEAGCAGVPAAQEVARLGEAVSSCTAKLAEAQKSDAEAALRAADDYLKLVAILLLAAAWARADAAAARAAEPDAFLSEKRQTARHFFAFVLPEAQLALARIEASLAGELPFLASAPA